MNHLYIKRITAFTITSLILGLSSQAIAQYVWLDDKGIKQYSDMPPPATVPNKRILKSAGPAPAAQALDVATESDNAAAAVKASPPLKLTTAEKNANFLKRRLEQAEKDKKAADVAQRTADKNKNCERASAYQNALESGQRISQQGKDGQRAYLSDANRAQELRDTKRILSECK
ncbi:MAG: DUF4124 domain-containing protein [Burkholderiaceae bacterium]